MSRGVVAAGHPLTAEAGAQVLREGGNAVDAAVCAVLTSFATESTLTGLGAGGFMLIQTPAGDSTVIDFFVEAPGREGTQRGAELLPVDIRFDESTTQVFNVGAASCAIPGAPAGLSHALRRYGTMPAGDLVAPGIRCATKGVEINRQQGFLLEILAPIYTATPELRAIYAPEGRILEEGETLRSPDLARALELFGAEGHEPFYAGEIGQAIAAHAQERGSILSRSDLAAYRAVERAPVSTAYRDCVVLTNPPPSSGGILIADALALLERLGDSHIENLVAALAAANEARDEAFAEGLLSSDFAERFLDPDALDAVAAEIRREGLHRGSREKPGDALGSTTHLVAVDADGACASVTCSNGTGSGIQVPGTGVHLNNMLGEEDLNPLGFHRAQPGTRLPSMMAPTVVLRGGEVLAGLGSAGSNRIRSAVVQSVVGLIDGGKTAQEAVSAPRIHVEAGAVQAEPGVDPDALGRIESTGMPIVRWARPNLFFGGVQAVARDPATGELAGGGDPRRGGAVAIA